MANAADKARFFLEQSVPELRELEVKKIFTRDEITSIAKKRSGFEHTINSRGSHASDYARYAEYEMNLEALRKHRVKRLGVKVPGFTGQKHIFFILQRGTRKFPTDIGLWMQYIEFARKEKAFKKLNDILASLLRLHPAKPELWIYAARYSVDTQADYTNARSYMQRGLRFCKHSKIMWIQWARLEMNYIAKIATRRKILGLDADPATKSQAQEDTEDMIVLPSLTAEDINPSLATTDAVDQTALQNLASSPALSGAIPLAVFDTAMNEFRNNASFAEEFFTMFNDFDASTVACVRKILSHVLDYLRQTSPKSAATAMCEFRAPLIGVPETSPDFASALGHALDHLNTSLGAMPESKQPLLRCAIQWILPLVRSGEITDSGIQKVLSSSLRKFCRIMGEENPNALVELAAVLRKEGRADDAAFLTNLITQMQKV
ncbi:rRNA processing protein Utp6 [Mytilinidion resinicola]|uniref:rRNA processing protein Utp6 n=1 Tax=Mytilinidion resinicola TaxID=574789 RepID=A0A6A6Y2X0_9PEZI|nr:rRNA processing protein Utp6 [Mytilinidion resinicola]KAF2803161.1 rRNA processing protein Utp6 [Mytilinidion resinicola]